MTCRVYSKNKFEKLVHLVGFIIRIYHNAWSLERQKRCYTVLIGSYPCFWGIYCLHLCSQLLFSSAWFWRNTAIM